MRAVVIVGHEPCRCPGAMTLALTATATRVALRPLLTFYSVRTPWACRLTALIFAIVIVVVSYECHGECA
jgi:hypothetical protein